jgi:serine/threonine protein phosphatase PrpC
MADPFMIKSGVRSHPGRKRTHNEDFITFFEPADPLVQEESGAVYIVADGVGGASEGERASQYAAEKVLHDYYCYPELEPGVRLKQAMQQASQEIFDYAESSQSNKRMATTIVAVAVRGGLLSVAHVGDSRAYLLRKGKATQLTSDHSTIGELVTQGLMTEEEALNSNSKNKLTRSLGAEAEAIVDMQSDIALQPGDRVLLCTDGLTRYALGQKIGELATSGTPEEAAKRLVDFANHQGGADNVSVIVISIEPVLESDQPALTTGLSRTIQGANSAPRGHLPEKVDWNTLRTQASRRKQPVNRLALSLPHKIKIYALPLTLLAMLFLAGGLRVAYSLWQRSGGVGQVLITTGMPAVADLSPVSTPIVTQTLSTTLSASPGVVTSVIPSGVITGILSSTPDLAQTAIAKTATQVQNDQIPNGYWCVYTVTVESKITIRLIVQDFTEGNYDQEFAAEILEYTSARPWADVWPQGDKKFLPMNARVAILFVNTKEECKKHQGGIEKAILTPTSTTTP